MANRARPSPSLQYQQHNHHYYPKDNQVFLQTNQDPFSDIHSLPTGRSRMPSTIPPPVATRAEVRNKMARSQSGAVPVASSRERPQRSQSEDSSSMPIERSRDRPAHSKSKNPAKKEKPLASAHADVIDKLDISGAGMFHHDGPFDAAAPSRNKQKNHRAPMLAFNGDPSQIIAAPHNVPVMDKRLSPLAQATIAAMANSSEKHGPYGAVGSGPYPTIGNAPPESNTPFTLLNPRKTTLAEAWGKAEPEPFEEFSAGTNTIGRSPANSIDGGYEGFYSRKQEVKARSAHPDSGAPAPRRNRIPPPQPINLPGSGGGSLPSSPTTSPTNETFGDVPSSPNQRPPVMKRTKSLMQRIRKMRENPNVPLGADANNGYPEAWTPGAPGLPEEDTFSAPESSRHAAAHNRHPVSRRRPSAEDGYYSDRKPRVTTHALRDKALPPPPPIPASPKDEGGEYFDQPRTSNLGRKTSLYQKVKGAVGGGNKTR